MARMQRLSTSLAASADKLSSRLPSCTAESWREREEKASPTPNKNAAGSGQCGIGKQKKNREGQYLWTVCITVKSSIFCMKKRCRAYTKSFSLALESYGYG